MFRKFGAPEGRSIGRLCISILSLARYPEAAVETLEGPALEPLERKGLGARYRPSGRYWSFRPAPEGGGCPPGVGRADERRPDGFRPHPGVGRAGASYRSNPCGVRGGSPSTRLGGSLTGLCPAHDLLCIECADQAVATGLEPSDFNVAGEWRPSVASPRRLSRATVRLCLPLYIWGWRSRSV